MCSLCACSRTDLTVVKGVRERIAGAASKDVLFSELIFSIMTDVVLVLVESIGAKDRETLILDDEMGHICDELVITTDDGSFGERGFVTTPLQKYLDERYDIKLAYAIGPIIMMKNVCKLTKKYNMKTMVSLNPVMIDGTGMCGGCRVTVDNRTQFCCVDGPDFDGHLVDFDELEKRNSIYLKDEKDSLLNSIR